MDNEKRKWADVAHDAELHNLITEDAWDYGAVREREDVDRETRANETGAHLGRIFGIAVEKRI